LDARPRQLFRDQHADVASNGIDDRTPGITRIGNAFELQQSDAALSSDD
jgi:hypothetical protein